MMHHSSVSQSFPFMSSPPPSRNQPQVPSYHLTSQTRAPHHLPEPHLVHHPHVTSPHLVHHPHVTSPHPQVTSPHQVPHPQVTSPHSQVTSPHPQVTSPHLVPHPQVTSPHLVHHPQVTSPHFVAHHLQHHLYNQNHEADLDPSDWSRCEPPSELSSLLTSYSYTYQNQTAAHVDLQNQVQFSAGGPHHRDTMGNAHSLPYTTGTHLASGLYGEGDPPGRVQGTWKPTLAQLQYPPPGSATGGVPQDRWSSTEFSSSISEDYPSTQYFHDSYQNNYAPQAFCSPGSPGPSPRYPQTPPTSSPGSQMNPRTERRDFNLQTSTQLSRDQSLSCRLLQEYDLVTSDPGQHHQLQTPRHLLQIQDQGVLLDTARNSELSVAPQGRGQDVGSAPRPPGLAAGQSGGGDDVQVLKKKQPKAKNRTEVLKSRLLCSLCQRDFRSLPALNGHMRSHSRSRSAAGSNKTEDAWPPVQTSVSMVMPVSVPVQSRDSAKACRSEQRRCSRRPPATGGAVSLYRSLLRQGEEEAVTKDGTAGARYTPPPMLSPVRAGPGLYCSLATRGQQTVRLNDRVAMETALPPPRTPNDNPRINEGRRFQAEIPPLRVLKDADSDSHNARLLWMPWDELERPASQLRVEALLRMARSSVVPGGGARPESALHVLSESRGDFLLTVEKLLSTPETALNAQQQPGAEWSAAERRSLVRSLQLHQKDFSRIQRAVQTKSLSQCVEFYYLWKRKLSLRTPTRLTVSLPDTKSPSPEAAASLSRLFQAETET